MKNLKIKFYKTKMKIYIDMSDFGRAPLTRIPRSKFKSPNRVTSMLHNLKILFSPSKRNH